MIRLMRLYCTLLLCGLMLSGTALAADQKGATVTLNLKDADINALISTVSEVTGKNFIVDPRVKGKVTVISSSPMQSQALYQTFLSVLAVQGFAAIPAGSVIKIVPETNARQLATPLSTGAGVPRDDIVTRVFTLNNASAAQLVPILRPLVPQWGQLAAYAPGNMLIVADRAANVRRLAGIIADLDAGNDQGVEIVPLKYAAADDVVQVLTTLAATAKKNDPTSHTPAIIPDARTNSVVIAGDTGDRERLLHVIQQLDTPTEGTGGSTQVIYLKYASAKDLAPILQGYAQKEVQDDSAGGKSSPATRKSATTTTSYGGGGNDKITVLADKNTNALIVSAPPKIMQQVKQVIKKLDIRRSQVQVEAIIAEVSANKASQLGVDWAVFNKHSIAAAGILDPSTLSSLSGVAGLSGTTGGLAGSAAGGAASAAAGLIGQGATIAAGSFGGATDFALLLHALKSDGDTNILSTPNITTLDNEEAKIEVGQEVPFLTGSYANSGVTSTAGIVNPFQTIDRKDVGLTLGITPTINQGDTIRLKIKLEDSSLTNSAASGNSGLTQITNKRTITDTVSVKNGQILVIGGLIGDQINQSMNGIPFLSSIPLIGSLFRYQQNSRTRQNLMVFIHPVILRSHGDIDYYTRMKYNEVRNAQIRSATGSATLIGGKRPVLYEWDDYLARHNRPAPASATSTGTDPAPTPPKQGPAPEAAPPPAPAAAPHDATPSAATHLPDDSGHGGQARSGTPAAVVARSGQAAPASVPSPPLTDNADANDAPWAPTPPIPAPAKRTPAAPAAAPATASAPPAADSPLHTFNLAFAGEAGFAKAIVLLFTAPVDVASAAHIRVDDSHGEAVPGHWTLSSGNPKMLVFDTAPGHYTVTVPDQVMDTRGVTLETALSRSVRVH